MIVALLLGLAISARQAGPLTSFTLQGKSVTPDLPQDPPVPYAKTAQAGGWTYGFSNDGQFQDRFKGKGLWDTLRIFHEGLKTQPDAVEWHTKIVLFTWADILDRGTDGVLRQRSGELIDPQTIPAMKEIALFGNMVEAFSQGHVKFVPDVEFEEQQMRFKVPDEQPFGPAWAKDYFESRINGFGYQPEDKVFRGPYQSVFAIHPGLVPVDLNTDLYGVPITTLPFFADHDSDHPGELAKHLFAAWLKHLEYSASRHGFPVGTVFPVGIPFYDWATTLFFPDQIVEPPIWRILANRKDTNDYLDNRSYHQETKLWQVPAAPAGGLTAAAVSVDFSADKTQLEATGDFKADLQLDPLKGTVAAISETDVVRMGRVRLVGGTELICDPSALPFFEIWVKPASDYPFDITVQTLKGQLHFGIFGADVPPAELGRDAKQEQIFNTQGSDWQLIVLDLRKVLNEPFSAIYIAPSQYAGVWHHPFSVKPSILVAKYALTAHPDGPETGLSDPKPPIPDAMSKDPSERALFAARMNAGSSAADKSKLKALLKDDDLMVALNAAEAYTRIKDLSVESALGDLTKSLNARIAEAAMDALASQGTDTSRGPLLLALLNGPFDHNRLLAARVLSRQKDPMLGGNFGNLVSSRSWETRLEGARALGILEGDRAQKTLLAYIVDTNPQVELAAVKLADASQDPTYSRMEWYAVNDAHDAIRAWASIALIRSPLPGEPEKGYKGLKDDSATTRMIILDFLKDHPVDAAKEPIKGALADKDFEVRAKALRTLAALPGPVTLEDVQPVLQDKDPREKDALADLAKSKAIKLPSATVELLRNDSRPRTAESAKY